MLILTRDTDEQLLIGEARVTILEVTPGKKGRGRVKLGIEAPSDLSIVRAELLQRAHTLSSSSAPSSQDELEKH